MPSVNFMIGVGLAVAGNLLIACSLTLQKHVHNLLEELPSEKRPAPSSNPLFFVAIFGLMFGEIGNFAAFGFAAPTVVSPLGAVSVICNALLSALVLKETFHLRNLVGLMLTVIGSVVIVSYAPPAVEQLTVDTFVSLLTAPPGLIFFAAVLVALAVLFLLVPRYGSTVLMYAEDGSNCSCPEWYLICSSHVTLLIGARVHLGLCSLLGSIMVVSTTAISKFLGQAISGDLSVLMSPVPYCTIPVVAFCTVMQLSHLNEAMSKFDSNQARALQLLGLGAGQSVGGGTPLAILVTRPR